MFFKIIYLFQKVNIGLSYFIVLSIIECSCAEKRQIFSSSLTYCYTAFSLKYETKSVILYFAQRK